MQVGELIGLLGQYDEEAEVLFVGQPSWPFEYSIQKVTERREVISEEEKYEHGFDGDMEQFEEYLNTRDDNWPDGKRGSDVLLVEGSQVRYGEKACWGGR